MLTGGFERRACMRLFVRRGQYALTAVVAAMCWCALSAGPALATLEGPCTASIAGQDVEGLSTGATSEPVDVAEGSDILVTMSSTRPLTHLEITLSYAGSEWAIEDKEISSRSWSESVPVDDYATYGKGLYLVKGKSTGNGFTCTAAALVNVEGNPLTSVAGAVGLGMAVIGIAGVGVAGIAAYRVAARPKRSIEQWTTDQLETLAQTDGPPPDPTPRVDRGPDLDDIADEVNSVSGGFLFCWTLALPALLLTTGAMMAGGGGAPERPAPKLPRARWRPRLSLGGILAGLVGAVGIGVLLQQYAVVYPTGSVTVTYLVAGLVAGVLLPSLTRLFAVRSVNRAAARAEERVAAARP
jgi:hypothetical protein